MCAHVPSMCMHVWYVFCVVLIYFLHCSTFTCTYTVFYTSIIIIIIIIMYPMHTQYYTYLPTIQTSNYYFSNINIQFNFEIPIILQLWDTNTRFQMTTLLKILLMLYLTRKNTMFIMLHHVRLTSNTVYLTGSRSSEIWSLFIHAYCW